MKSVVRLSAAVAPLLLAAPVFATTYYVDAANGNDRWSGKLQSASGTDGPWQSMAKASAAALKAGDSLLLKCGNTWRSPLAVKVSGTATAPVSVGSYPASCSQKPAIDGSYQLPAARWAAHGSGIYKTSWPADMVLNNTMDSGLGYWGKWSPAGDAAMSLSSSCGTAGNCVSFRSGTGSGNSIASSNGFPLEAGTAYTASFRLLVPAGVTVKVFVRRAATPWEPLGVAQSITGNGAWTTHTLPFTAARSVPAARLDFEVPPGGKTIAFDDVSVKPTWSAPLELFAGNTVLEPAHHPNRGHDAALPRSVYLNTASDADRVLSNGKYVSTFIPTGSDLVLPSGAALDSKVTVRFRTTPWLMEERQIKSVSGSRLYLSTPTSYPLLAGYGYYFVGALWMLDSPGEWFYDAAQKMLYVRMPDSQAPGNLVAVAHQPYGVDLAGRASVVVRGLAVRKVGVGVRMASSKASTFRDGEIADTAQEGIDAAGATDGLIENNLLANTGRDAVSGVNAAWVSAQRLRVQRNTVSNSGVRASGAAAASLPVQSYGAIRGGQYATVTGNSVVGSGYTGVTAMTGSTVSQNHVENACLVLDDCAGIYVNAAGSNSTISNNLVASVPGNPDGKPGRLTHAVGIYLDDHAKGVSVLNNAVTASDYGIQLHNAYSNRIEGNTLYGNRITQLWLQEQTKSLRTAGDLYDNQVLGNLIFPTTTDAGVMHESKFSGTDHFASYDRNLHSTLLSPRVAAEQWSGGGVAYAFPDWQKALDRNQVPRNLDANGEAVSSGSFASYRVVGANVVPNGNLASGAAGWGGWSAKTPLPKIVVESCPAGKCLRMVAGASESILSTPYFSVVKGQWYRLTFDLKTGAAGDSLAVLVRRGGGGTNTYERLMGAPEPILGNGAWNRYAILFQAPKTVKAGDPVTLDNGARLDFEKIPAGKTVSVANVAIQAVSPLEATLQTRLLTNPELVSAARPCPDESTQPQLCSMYVSFPDKRPVAWPVTLEPVSAQIVFTQDQSLADSDQDGIPDSQDACASSPAGKAVNNRGCSFAQDFP